MFFQGLFQGLHLFRGLHPGRLVVLALLFVCLAHPAHATQLFGGGGGGSGGIYPPAGDIGGTAGAPTVIAIHRTTALIVNAQSPYSVASGDSYLDCNATGGAVTLNLPAATGSGRVLTLKKMDSTANACTFARAGSDTIDGATSLALSIQYVPFNLVDAASGKWDVVSLNIVAGTGISASTANGVTTVTVNLAGGTCTNQYATALSATGTLSCSTPTLAGAAFANQGTTTTLLHGNAAGNPSWAGVSLANDTLANQGTTTTLLHGNAAGQPSFGAVTLGTDVSGTLGTGNGGTGSASPTGVSAGTGISVSGSFPAQTVTANLAGGTCTNQFGTSLSSTGTLSCSTDTLASARHANQGTTTTLLHGNAAGNPAFTGVDILNDTLANQGTTTTLLHGNAAGRPTYAAVNLANDTTGTLPPTKLVSSVPPGLQYFGNGVEADPNLSSGVTTINGTHYYTSFTISGSGQMKVGTTVGWARIIVNGACSIASTATCTKEDGTSDSACAIDLTGPNNGVGTNTCGLFGGNSAGGGAAGTTNNGNTGNNVWNANFPTFLSNGPSGGVVGGASPGNGGSPSAASAKAFLDALSTQSPEFFRGEGGTCSGSYNFGGASGNSAGGAGTGTGGVGNGRGGAVLVLACKSFTTTTGHIVASGAIGGAGTSCGNAGGAGGSGGGAVIVAGPGGYTGANIDVNGGTGGTACAGGQNGAIGGKGMGWNCDTTANTCTAL